MRGAWLVVCALSLVRAHRVSPMPADPELNAKWLEGFRRDLLRDAYDDETNPIPSPSILGEASSTPSVYLTHAPENAPDRPPARYAVRRASHRPGPRPDKPVISTVGHRPSRPGFARNAIGHKSDRPSPPPDAPMVGHRLSRTGSPTDAVGHMSSRPSDAPSAGEPPARSPVVEASVEQSSGKSGPPPDTPNSRRSIRYSFGNRHLRNDTLDTSGMPVPAPDRRSPGRGRSPARHSPDVTSVEHLKGELGRPPEPLVLPLVRHLPDRLLARSPDDAASRELGISRRDLYGGRDPGSITDIGQELDAIRQPFLKSMHEFDDQMVPVVVPHGANSDNRLRRNKKSRKRLGGENSEQDQDKPPYIFDQNGIKRYRVHTDPRERFRNQFGGDVLRFKEEWGIDEFDEMREPSEERYQERGDDNLAQNEDDRYQDSGDESSSQDERVSVMDSQELNVSEYHQENVRSRYIQRGRPEGDYAQRFSARRDAALLADGLASSTKPCDCITAHPQIVPEL